MATFRKPLPLALLAILAFITGIALFIYVLPLKGMSVYHKPEQAYEHYYIYAEEDGRELMRVPIVVNIDDELLTEDNKRYKVIRVDGDKAIARFVEIVDIQQFAPKQQ